MENISTENVLSELSFSDMQTWIKPRPQTAHKGLFGRVLVIGGDIGMPGAVKLAALGALEMGAGIVSVLTRPDHLTATVSYRPEILCHGMRLGQIQLLKKELSRATVVVLGPGLGQSRWSRWLFKNTVHHIRQYHKPCVIDADALNLIAKTHWLPNDTCIYTPHPGEAARLLGATIDEIQCARIHAIKSLQRQLGGVIILKGAETLVHAFDETIAICHEGNPAMATGGMGDLLSGLIAGLLTQGLTLLQASQMAVLMHAQAGDVVYKKQGGLSLLASDLLPAMKPLLNKNFSLNKNITHDKS